MANFKKEGGDWKRYRQLERVLEIDFHFDRREHHVDYLDCMAQAAERALDGLREAQQKGCKYVLFTHGWSTSRRGKTTARSQVRRVMKSTEATPYIDRANSIQHESVFVAAIKALATNASA